MSDDRPRLTLQQRAALTAITAHVERFGYPPTVREIGAEIGLSSTSSVAHVLRALQWKGYLLVEPGRPRAIRVVA